MQLQQVHAQLRATAVRPSSALLAPANDHRAPRRVACLATCSGSDGAADKQQRQPSRALDLTRHLVTVMASASLMAATATSASALALSPPATDAAPPQLVGQLAEAGSKVRGAI